jgi:hypothetical protein
VKYRVNILAIIDVPVDVEAGTPQEAAQAARDHLVKEQLMERLIDGKPTGQFPLLPGDLLCGYTGQIIDYLVDHEGDLERRRSVWVSPDDLPVQQASLRRAGSA